MQGQEGPSEEQMDVTYGEALALQVMHVDPSSNLVQDNMTQAMPTSSGFPLGSRGSGGIECILREANTGMNQMWNNPGSGQLNLIPAGGQN